MTGAWEDTLGRHCRWTALLCGHVWAFQSARGPDGTLSCDGVQLAGSSRGSFPAGRSESMSLVLNLPEQMG